MDTKKEQEWYNKALKEASTVESPSNVKKNIKHKGKVLGKYNDLIY